MAELTPEKIRELLQEGADNVKAMRDRQRYRDTAPVELDPLSTPQNEHEDRMRALFGVPLRCRYSGELRIPWARVSLPHGVYTVLCPGCERKLALVRVSGGYGFPEHTE